METNEARFLAPWLAGHCGPMMKCDSEQNLSENRRRKLGAVPSVPMASLAATIRVFVGGAQWQEVGLPPHLGRISFQFEDQRARGAIGSLNVRSGQSPGA